MIAVRYPIPLIIILLFVFVVGVPIAFGYPMQIFRFGINAKGLNEQSVKAIQYLKSDIVRLDVFPWDFIEKSKGDFDFTIPDRNITLARENKFKVVGILQYSPAWASGVPSEIPPIPSKDCGIPVKLSGFDKLRTTPPKDPKDFGNFVQKVVGRYPDIEYWQIWNEPNSATFWPPTPNAKAYTELLKEASIAAKRANPNAKIVLGGLSLNDLDFLSKIYDAEGRYYFDIMAVHPYNVRQAPDKYLDFELRQTRKFMDEHGDIGKPIWITEIGWPTSADEFGVGYEKQAEYVTRLYNVIRSFDFVTGVFWHTLDDCSTVLRNKDNPEHNYGLFDSSWLPKPAARVYRYTDR